MMITLSALALQGMMLGGGALPAPMPIEMPAIIGCHPQPGKVMGCSTPIGVMKPARKAKVADKALEADASPADIRHCHPDPSRNRGCTVNVPRSPA